MYKTEVATQDELSRWNQIISRCPYSESLHTLEWRNALATCFKQMEPLYFTVRDESGSIAGALCCFIFRPIPLSKSLLSMPWALPGGPLFFPGTNVATATLSVCDKLDEISRRRRLSEAVFTLPSHCSADITSSFTSAGYSVEAERFTHILNVEAGFDAVWNAYNKRVRGAVRKAEKTGVIVRETEDEADMMEFYRLYLKMMSRFDSTPKPLSLLKYLQTSPIARLVVAQLADRIIAGLLFLHFNSSVRLWCEASDPDYLLYRPNNVIINYIIRWACERGYKLVDFGASPPENEGLVAFKEEWRAKKVWFHTLARTYSPWKRRLWAVSEPSVRRIYAAIQRFKI